MSFRGIHQHCCTCPPVLVLPVAECSDCILKYSGLSHRITSWTQYEWDISNNSIYHLTSTSPPLIYESQCLFISKNWWPKSQSPIISKCVQWPLHKPLWRKARPLINELTLLTITVTMLSVPLGVSYYVASATPESNPKNLMESGNLFLGSILTFIFDARKKSTLVVLHIPAFPSLVCFSMSRRGLGPLRGCI